MHGLCVICAATLISAENEHGDEIDYKCPQCGFFTLTKEAESAIQGFLDGDKRSHVVLTHAIMQMRRRSTSPTRLDLEAVRRILMVDVLPSPFEQADNLVLWLGDNLIGDPGAELELLPNVMPTMIGAATYAGYRFVLGQLLDEGMVAGPFANEALNQKTQALCKLTFKGWERYNALQRGTSDSRKAFMAMKFGDPLMQKIFTDVLRRAVEATGFELRTLEDQPKAGLIDDRMRVEIRTSRFLVADLTHGNHGAYWEAGYAEGLGKPVFYTCKKSVFRRKKTHFDTNHHYTIEWDEQNPADAVVMLKAAIRATLPMDAKLTDD